MKQWKMELAGTDGEIITVTVDGTETDNRGTVFGRMFDKLISEGKDPTNYMPNSNPVFVNESELSQEKR